MDSHIYALKDVPKRVLDELTNVDLIVHAGDYVGKDLLEGLQCLTDFKGVYGNMDPPEIRGKLSAFEVFELMGHRIRVTYPAEGGSPFRLERRVREEVGKLM